MRIVLISTGMIVGGLLLSQPVSAEQDKTAAIEFFEKKIRPVLAKHCYECHSSSSEELEGGLSVDFRDGLLKGGDSGKAVVPGKPDESLLLEALRYESLEMPPEGKLPAAVIKDFEHWIQTGAADPRERPLSATDAAEAAWAAKLTERAKWWSLQPPRKVTPPEINDSLWSREPVDRFVRASLDKAKLHPAPPADPETLYRRLSFVLTGLPPKPAQSAEFVRQIHDDEQAALESAVDRFLASPHFGERFARHWMDVVRYTDTYGYEWDNPVNGSWEYRDYLIRAFNADVGFDQLIREQIAGDLLPQPRINQAEGLNESLIGPTFYHMGEHRHGSSLDFNGIHQDMVDNKIDAFSKAFLAGTVACSRCHDHKLDAVSQKDYYALAGVFMSPRWTTRVIDLPDKYAAQIEQLKKLRAEIDQGLRKRWGDGSLVSAVKLKMWAEAHQAKLKTAKPHEISHPIAQLLAAKEGEIANVWQELETQWTTAREKAVERNSKLGSLITFEQPGLPDDWVGEGAGFVHGYANGGTPLVALDGEQLVKQLLQRGYHTHALSSKLPAAVRPPAQAQIPGKVLALQIAGGEWAGSLVVPQNAFQSEQVKFLNQTSPSWTPFADASLKNGVTRVTMELATSSLNPNFPPRTGLARAGELKLPEQDLGRDKRSWFSLTGIATYDDGGPPSDELEIFRGLYNGDSPASTDQAWERISKWLAGAIERWAAEQANDDDVRSINWLLTNGLLPNAAADAPDIAKLVARYREIEAQIGFPRTANSMDERNMQPINYRLNVRGNVDEDGPAVPRNFLQVFHGKHRVHQSAGSGRLELAEYLAAPQNPQTARVYVNRVWHWIFGTGIVATPNDFGKLGGRPSHPELLDWLARKYVEEGWSTKKLIRRLVLSRTFRQSGQVDPAAVERDPGNRLLHHYPTRRLEAEAIRDALLAVSGRLDAKLYGPPINPRRSVEDPAKRLYSGPPDGGGRRSLYLTMSIMDPSKFLTGFNMPDLRLPTGRRDVTNVPAQALILLNDPLVVQLAESWAERLLQDGHSEPVERIRQMFQRALGRQPTETELQRWTESAKSFAARSDLMQDQQAWAAIAHAMFNSSEFIYYR